MSESIFSKLVREPNGAYTVSYGPFLLQSALQPIFRNLVATYPVADVNTAIADAAAGKAIKAAFVPRP